MLGRLFDPKGYPVRFALSLTVVFLLAFAVAAVLSIQVWEYTNSTAFCATACHQVHPEEPGAYQDSYHARVKCVECHMGRLGTLKSIAIKSGHAKHLPAVIFRTYHRPLRAESMRPAGESCEQCHWPPAFHGDTVREVKHYLPDQENTARRTYLILKTGGGPRNQGQGYGIHWHIENPVEFIADDEGKQRILWVRTTLPDGRTVEYRDVADPVRAEISGAEVQVMDCMDCHNRVGHPFPSPEQAVSGALAEGRVSGSLPFIAKEMMQLLATEYADQESALAAVDAFAQGYATRYPGAGGHDPGEIERAGAAARASMERLVFAKPGITWRSFPDDRGHKDFPGCFRCHDGNHRSESGESIRLHCNICHSIPVTVGADDRPPEVPIKSLTEPPSHYESSFMADHRFQANGSCSACHGPIKFGSDDSSFCATSACHGTSWPMVELDAGSPHPISLEGGHAKAWCHECHQGVKKPVNQCAACHRGPSGHFAADCQGCHATSGWRASAASVRTAAPRVPHPPAGMGPCAVCHEPGGQVRPAPAGHRSYTEAQCAVCHQAPTKT